MLITVFFTSNGVPKTGLSPTITIYDMADGAILINGVAMTERAGGFYVYDYVAYANTKNYGIVADGGAVLANSERYSASTNESVEIDTKIDTIDTKIDTIDTKIDKILGLVHQNIHIDEAEYDDYGNMVSSRIRIYSNPLSVGGSANVIATYTVTSVGTDAGKFSSWQQVEQIEIDYLEFEDDAGVLALEDGNLLVLG
jgi:hypothetical protein